MAEDNFSGNPQVRDLGTTEEDEEVERLDKVTGSVSQYSSARESLHSEYMAVILIPDSSILLRILSSDLQCSLYWLFYHWSILPRCP